MGVNIWRKVDNVAVLCNECPHNVERPLYLNGEPSGLERICTAENDICVRLKKPIQNDKKAYEDFKDIFRETEDEVE